MDRGAQRTATEQRRPPAAIYCIRLRRAPPRPLPLLVLQMMNPLLLMLTPSTSEVRPTLLSVFERTEFRSASLVELPRFSLSKLLRERLAAED